MAGSRITGVFLMGISGTFARGATGHPCPSLMNTPAPPPAPTPLPTLPTTLPTPLLNQHQQSTHQYHDGMMMQHHYERINMMPDVSLSL